MRKTWLMHTVARDFAK